MKLLSSFMHVKFNLLAYINIKLEVILCFQLAMSAHDNATPIRILPNSAGHMNGPARSLGAILIGYLGKET